MIWGCLGAVAHRYMGRPFPHLAAGIRLPSIVAPPVLAAMRDSGSTGALMLSYHRETGSEAVVRGGSQLRGHTGTTIREYISAAVRAAGDLGMTIHVEADHVSISPSPERAIKRIAGGGFEEGVTEEEAKASLRYIEEELREARDAGGVDVVAIDTCELINHDVDSASSSEVEAIYEDIVGEEVRLLERLYLERPLRFIGPGGVHVELKIGRGDLARLAAKYWRSLEYFNRIYRLAGEVLQRPFGVEAVLDETPRPTEPLELAFYLSELSRRGVPVDYVAPNVGFEKREDYRGRLEVLESRLRRLSAVAWGFGAILSIHSGSGHNPYSDKGHGVWEAVRRATGGMVKYKVSGVYIQLLLEVMSRFPKGSRPRRLYEDIFDYVLDSVRRIVAEKRGLYSPSLEDMLRRYEEGGSPYDPRSDFFRHYFFLFQAYTVDGRRPLREEVLRLVEEDRGLWEAYYREAYSLTRRIHVKLGLEGNLRFLGAG